MTRPDRQAADSLAERLSGLDLPGRLHLIAAEIPGRLVFTTSLGVEDQALTHALAMAGLAKGRVEIVTLDTGRLFAETYDTWTETESAYGIRITAYAPERAAAEAFVREEGINGFRRSVAARQACCGFRKVEPLGRALAGAGGWLTGLRGERGSGGEVATLAWDVARELWKAAPLADWSRDEVAAYCAARDVPVSPLHAAGYPSIGCQPCTRAVLPGEDERAGRWWWEQTDSRECGLHVGADGRLARTAGASA